MANTAQFIGRCPLCAATANMTILPRKDRQSPTRKWRGRCGNNHLIELQATVDDGRDVPDVEETAE